MSTLLIWDSATSWTEDEDIILLWKCFPEERNEKTFSIHDLVELNSDILKREYLSWLYKLGTIRHGDYEIFDAAGLLNGLSYWWITDVVESSYSKSNSYTDSIRLIFLGKWIKEKKITRITIATANNALKEAVRKLCAEMEISFNSRKVIRLSNVDPGLSLVRRIYRRLPRILSAVVFCCHYYVSHRPIKGIGINGLKKNPGEVTIFTYLTRPSRTANEHERHDNHYWGQLPNLLRGKGLKVNWVHLLAEYPTIDRGKDAVKIIRKFQENKSTEDNHVLPETFLRFSHVLTAIAILPILKVRFIFIRYILYRKSPENNFLLPLIIPELKKSFSGATAIKNILDSKLFELISKTMPKQLFGLYLMENQGWELQLINAWKNQKHGDIIGVPHSYIRYWDLRYFKDPRSYLYSSQRRFPIPDYIALNGLVAIDNYTAADYPIPNLVEVEALRYQYLSELQTSSHLFEQNTKAILVLGDFDLGMTLLLIRIVNDAQKWVQGNYQIILKPHPANEVKINSISNLNCQLTNRPVTDLFANYYNVFASPTTTAAMEAFVSGMNVTIYLDAQTVNLSPLRGISGVTFVRSSKDLASALNVKSGTRSKGCRVVPFTVDKRLSRWSRVIDYYLALKEKQGSQNKVPKLELGIGNPPQG